MAANDGALLAHVVSYVRGVRDGMALRANESRPDGATLGMRHSYALGLEEGVRRRLSGHGAHNGAHHGSKPLADVAGGTDPRTE